VKKGIYKSTIFQRIDATCAKIAQVQKEGTREVTVNVQ